MHLESPDKRPTEYGQNPKEFVMQEKLLIAACLFSADWTDWTEEIRGILAVIRLIGSGSNVKRKLKPSIYWCHLSPHPLLSINNWEEQDLRISGGRDCWLSLSSSSPSVPTCLTWSLFTWRYSLRYTLYISPLSTLHPLPASDNFSEIKCFSFAVGDLRVSVVVFLN